MQMNTFKMAALYKATLYHSTYVQSKDNLVQQQTGKFQIEPKNTGYPTPKFWDQLWIHNRPRTKKKKKQIANEVKH